MNETDMDEITRLEQIRRFAEAYVTALGLTGDDRANIQHEIEQTLVAHELLDDAALVTRVRRMQRDEDLRASGLSQEKIDAVREQLYGTTAGDTYRGQISRFLELVVQGDDSARQRAQDQLDAARRDVEVSPEQVAALERLVRDTIGEEGATSKSKPTGATPAP